MRDKLNNTERFRQTSNEGCEAFELTVILPEKGKAGNKVMDLTVYADTISNAVQWAKRRVDAGYLVLQKAAWKSERPADQIFSIGQIFRMKNA